MLAGCAPGGRGQERRLFGQLRDLGERLQLLLEAPEDAGLDADVRLVRDAVMLGEGDALDFAAARELGAPRGKRLQHSRHADPKLVVLYEKR